MDLKRFMGDWYVISCIGTSFESKAFDSLEHYELKDNGSIAVSFSMRSGSATAPLKTNRLKAGALSAQHPSNAVWWVQLLWPFKAEYLIAHVDEDYQTTIIARSKLDYVWLMARTPTIDDSLKKDLHAKIQALGYDASKLRDVPQAKR